MFEFMLDRRTSPSFASLAGPKRPPFEQWAALRIYLKRRDLDQDWFVKQLVTYEKSKFLRKRKLLP